MSEHTSDYDLLIAPIRRRMVNSVWRIVRDPDDTEDVIQEVVLRILKKIRDIRSHPNPTALILRICVNAAIDHLRHGQSRNRALQAFGDSLRPESTAPSPREALVRQERDARVREALRTLPRREAEAVVLMVLEDLAYPEIAQAMGCRESTVRVLVSRARKRLRAQFSQPGSVRVMEVGTS